MTRRGARLVIAAAALAWTAAALAFLAPRLPEGLATACAPDLVARELLAGLAVAALLLAPAFVADDPERRPEDHTALLVVLPGLPAAMALAAAGGGAPGDLLPAVALLLACDLAASSYLRADPAGGKGILWAGAAAALLAGIPIAAYGLAEFAGWEGAAAAFRVSPLLAIRDVAGGWSAVAPAALLLVGAAALLRFGGALLRPAAATAGVAILVFALPSALAEERSYPRVLVVGAPREGEVARFAEELRRNGFFVRELDTLAEPLDWYVEVVFLGRPARDATEAAAWKRTLQPFAESGGRVFGGLDRKELGDILGVPGEETGWEYVECGLGFGKSMRKKAGRHTGPANDVTISRVAVPHPADRSEPGVDPTLHRISFPAPVRSLPGSTLAFLAVLAAASGGTALLARRRGMGQARTLLALGGVSAVGSSMLFLPGVLGDPFRVERLVVEERLEGRASGRHVELLRIERLRPGGADPVVGAEQGVSWAEIRYAADSEPAWRPDGTVRLEAPGRYALFAGVSGVYTPPPAGPFLATVLVEGDRAWTRMGPVDALSEYPAPDGPGNDVASTLTALSRSTEPRVARAGVILARLFRPPSPGSGHYLFVVPAEGVDAVVLHLTR